MFLGQSNSTTEVSARFKYYQVLLNTKFTQRNFIFHVFSTAPTENLREEEKMWSLTKLLWDLNWESCFIIVGLKFSPGTTLNLTKIAIIDF